MHPSTRTEPADHLPRGRERRPLVLSRSVWSLGSWPRLLAVTLGIVLAFWAADRALLGESPPSVDTGLLDRIATQRTDAMVDAARVLTFLGDLWVVLAVWAVLVTLARRRSGRWDLAWLVTAVVGGVLVITVLIKELTVRARPSGTLVEAASFAFPSGHAGRAAAVWGLVAWLGLRWGRNRTIRAGVGVLAVAMMLTTGIARLVLGVHWPSDVLFGWALGVVWLTACILVVQPRHGVPRPQTVLDDLTDTLAHTFRRDAGTATADDADGAGGARDG